MSYVSYLIIKTIQFDFNHKHSLKFKAYKYIYPKCDGIYRSRNTYESTQNTKVMDNNYPRVNQPTNTKAIR